MNFGLAIQHATHDIRQNEKKKNNSQTHVVSQDVRTDIVYTI